MSLIDRIVTILTDEGARFQTYDDAVVLGFTGRSTRFTVEIVPRDPLIRFVVTVEAVVPEARRAETLALANILNARRVPWGAFWLDPRDGALAFELALPVLGDLDPETLRFALAATATLDAFWPAFGRVIWANEGAESALAAWANDPPPPPASALSEAADTDDPLLTI